MDSVEYFWLSNYVVELSFGKKIACFETIGTFVNDSEPKKKGSKGWDAVSVRVSICLKKRSG